MCVCVWFFILFNVLHRNHHGIIVDSLSTNQTWQWKNPPGGPNRGPTHPPRPGCIPCASDSPRSATTGGPGGKWTISHLRKYWDYRYVTLSELWWYDYCPLKVFSASHRWEDVSRCWGVAGKCRQPLITSTCIPPKVGRSVLVVSWVSSPVYSHIQLYPHDWGLVMFSPLLNFHWSITMCPYDIPLNLHI